MAKRKQAGASQDTALIISRDKVWEMHLRSVPKARIARELGIDRETVTRHIKACYQESGRDLKTEREAKLDAAILRLRRIQEQAWNYCDADDERERGVLERAAPGTRYQSQRGQYLKVILDAEKEIARLEGLYEALGEELGAVVFRVVREGMPGGQEGTTVTTARLALPVASGQASATDTGGGDGAREC